MKKILTISVCLIIVCSFLLIGNTRADAMNNESAAMLAGAIALFGRPILNSIANDVFYYSYSTFTYPARTRVKHFYPGHRRYYGKKSFRPYRRGWRDERYEMEYRRGRMDARRNYYYNDYRRW
jgi:hypothetical protein